MTAAAATAAAAVDRVELTYTPHGAARDLFHRRDIEVVLSGPAGTGKSRACMEKLHLAASKHPGARILFVRKTRTSLTQSGMITFANKVLHPRDGVQFRQQEQEYRYPNGSRIVVGGLDKDTAILSAEYDIAYVQEATEISETDWETIISRLRYGRMPYRQIIADCNPASSRHWLYRRAHGGGSLVMLHSEHRDNPELFDGTDWTPFGVEYIGQLERMTGLRRERLLYGRWTGGENLVYADFDPERAIAEVDCDGWRTILGVDVGTRNPTAILTVRIAGDDRVHVEREVYRRNMSAQDILAAVTAEADRCAPEAVVIDPSAASYIADLERAGYPTVRANNDRKFGIGVVDEAIADGMTVDPSCANLLEEFGEYRYPERGGGDDPVKDNDHALDALRYVLATERGTSVPAIW